MHVSLPCFTLKLKSYSSLLLTAGMQHEIGYNESVMIPLWKYYSEIH